MYAVKGDNITIYNDVSLTESMKAINPKLTLKDNSAGTFEITLPPGNAGYEKLKRMKSEITVYRDNSEIWSGRIISEKKDFWNNRILTCEGELAYLNDTTQPPAKFSGLTVRQFIDMLLQNHNDKVSENKRFEVGAVTVEDNNAVWFTNNENTLASISENLVGQYGGHLRVRKADNTRYLDYLKDYPSENTQVIRFGQNLLDFTKNWDMTELATVVTPKGARLNSGPIDELEAYLDVSEVNGGSRYVTNEEGIKEFGWIETVVEWSDVDDAQVLLDNAKQYLSEQQFDEITIEVKAVDLRYLGITTDSVQLLDKVRCISRPHGLDKIFPVSELTLQLDSPENSTYILGSTEQGTLTSSIKETNSLVNKIDNKPTSLRILKSARDNALQMINSATRGYVTIGRSSPGEKDEATEYIAIASNLSYNPDEDKWLEGTNVWLWNMNGLAYFKEGKTKADRELKVAMTADGAIVADRITVGTMSADRIRTGLLMSEDKNVVWNLNADDTENEGITYKGGSLTIRKGSIAIGKPLGIWGGDRFSVSEDGEVYANSGTIGGFTIDSDSISNDKLHLDGYGLNFKSGTDIIGSFSTNHWTENRTENGIVMNLTSDGKFISWGVQELNSDGNEYTTKLWYVAEGANLPRDNGRYFSDDTLYIGCPLDINGYRIKNGKDEFVDENAVYIPTAINTSTGVIQSCIKVKIKNGFIVLL